MGANIGNPTRRGMILTGTYTGDGNDDRNINIGTNLAAKSNVWVVVKSIGSLGARHRTEYGQGDLTFAFDAGSDAANEIQQFTSTGFQIGSAARINDNGQTFRYIVFWQEG